MTIRVRLIAIVGLLGVLLMAGGTLFALDAWRTTAGGARAREANSLSDHLGRMLAAIALERGAVNVLLLDPDQFAEDQRNALVERHNLIQRELSDLLAEVVNLDFIDEDLPLADIRRAQAEFTEIHQRVGQALKSDSSQLRDETADLWSAKATNLLDSLSGLRRAVDRSMPSLMDPAISRGLELAESISEMAEFAGRERDVTAGVIASGLPFTSDDIEAIGEYRGRVQSAWSKLASRRAEFSGVIAEKVTFAGTGYFEEFERLRRRVSAASAAQADYPVTPVEWFRQSTVAINRILDIQPSAAEAVGKLIDARMADAYRRLSVSLVLIAVSVIGVIAALAIVTLRISNPLAAIANTLRDLSSGQLDVSIPGRYQRDEVGAVAMAAQIFKEQAVELEIARQMAESAATSKADFLATMSHEIRTPMNGVMTMADLLDQTPLSPEQKGMTKIIRESSTALLTVIDDILDFSKIEAGKLTIDQIDFSLTEAMESVADLLAPRADEKGIALYVEVDPRLPLVMVGDPNRLRQIAINLVGNALKFTETGHVAIRAQAIGYRADGQRMRIRLEVVDTGIGLTTEQRLRLFQPFSQADQATSRRFGGTGLGLSICRRLVDQMGGIIDVESVPGEGSTFWVELDLEVAIRDAPKPPVDISDARILVAGGDTLMAGIIERYLRATGVTDIWRSADASGLVAALGRAIDVAILVPEPTAASLEAARSRVLAAKNSETPAILIVPRAQVSTIQASALGHFTTVTRPLRLNVLWNAVAVALHRIDPALLDQSGGIVIESYTPPPIEHARAVNAVVLVAEDNPTNQVVVGTLLARLGFAYEIVDNGAQALAKIEGNSYGLILTDFHMPEMDGFELARRVRLLENERGDWHVPMLALTADALPGTEQQCLDAGMDGYLAKPIDRSALAAALARFLPQALPLRRPETAHSVFSSGLTPLPLVAYTVFDPTVLGDVFGGMTGPAKEMLHGFLQSTEKVMEGLNTAISQREPNSIVHAAHNLKGSSAQAGAKELSALAAQIEAAARVPDLDGAVDIHAGVPRAFERLRATIEAL